MASWIPPTPTIISCNFFHRDFSPPSPNGFPGVSLNSSPCVWGEIFSVCFWDDSLCQASFRRCWVLKRSTIKRVLKDPSRSTVVRGLSGAPLYLTRKGSRVWEQKIAQKNSSKSIKNTSARHRPRKQNSYQISMILVCSSSLVPSFAQMVLGRDQFPPRTTHPSI